MNRLIKLANKFRDAAISEEEKGRRDIAKIFAALLLFLEPFIDATLDDIYRQKLNGNLNLESVKSLDSFSVLSGLSIARFAEAAQQTVNRVTQVQTELVIRSFEQAISLALASIGLPKDKQDFIDRFLTISSAERQTILSSFTDANRYRFLLDLAGPRIQQYISNQFIKTAIEEGITKAKEDLITQVAAVQINAETTIATEAFNSYRGAFLSQYKQLSSVEGWVWTATLDDKTCPVCIYLHGQIFSLDDPFFSHANCRCIPIPIMLSFTDLGYPGLDDNIEPIQTGVDWFNEQSSDFQRRTLGPGKYKLFSSGKISLADLVGESTHPVWGKVRFERNLRDLRN